MWKRRQLKRNAKSALKRNYWRCVLAALILASITGSVSGGLAGGGAGAAGSGAGMMGFNYTPESQIEGSALPEGVESVLPKGTEAVLGAADIAENGIGSAKETPTWEDVMDLLAQMPEVQALKEQLAQLDRSDLTVILAIVGGVVGAVVLLALLLEIFFINPLIAGCKYFFAHNSREKAMVGTVASGYDCGYGRVVKGMFLKSLFLFFWTLLFLIPGIIKSFSYRMVPYILVDQPELTATQAITRSRQMMKGNKWRAFVLDLSFILWYLLSALTLGLLGLFFVNPYYEATNAELYHALKGEEDAPMAAVEDEDGYAAEVPPELPEETPEPPEETPELPEETPEP